MTEFCGQYAKEGMLDVKSKRFGHSNREKRPTFGSLGERREFCSPHAKKAMVDVNSRQCQHPTCMKQASFGKYGGRTREFYGQHAKEGNIDLSLSAHQAQYCCSGTFCDGGGSSNGRPRKRPRHPGDVSSVPHHVEEGMHKAASPSDSSSVSQSAKNSQSFYSLITKPLAVYFLVDCDNKRFPVGSWGRGRHKATLEPSSVFRR